MSHFTEIKTQIRDIDALREGCTELGLELLENTEARGFGSKRQHGEYVIRLRGPYDIALNKQPDSTYGLTTDWWNNHVEREVGKGYGLLLQRYGVCKTIREARKRGHMVRRHKLKDGAVKLQILGV